jgi:hypothetical protein
MFLLYKFYYTGYCLYTENYRLSHQAASKQVNPTVNRPGTTQVSIRNLHRTSSSHLRILSSVTVRVSRLMIATQQVNGKI